MDAAKRAPQYMRVFGNAQPPYGFVRFCETRPDECNSSNTDDQRLQATPERLSELDEINRAVNRDVEPATDMEIYGVNEMWTLPKGRGDCEDFALLKRQELLKRGWPSNAFDPEGNAPTGSPPDRLPGFFIRVEGERADVRQKKVNRFPAG